MIGLYQFLEAVDIRFNPDNTKVHLACWNGREHPIDEYYAGRFKYWQEEQGKRNFECDFILSLIDLGNSNWLFAGVYKKIDCVNVGSHYKYSTSLLSGQDDIVGKIIIHHDRSRASYIWYRPELIFPIVEIRRKKLTIAEFPGYNSVTISHTKLKIIIEQKIASWHVALANIKGVYLITDTNTGKPYVGKASGTDGIWQRWCSYAKDGHGGNIELKNVIKQKGPDYASNFQYSILEIADTHASDKAILERESYWMNALLSRKFGMN